MKPWPPLLEEFVHPPSTDQATPTRSPGQNFQPGYKPLATFIHSCNTTGLVDTNLTQNMASDNDKRAAAAAAPPEQQPETLLYFAFGSNLSSSQMSARCPGSAAVGLAFLPDYDFIINERGFANVVPSTTSSATTTTTATTTATTPPTTEGDDYRRGGVYGVLYRLSSPAEKKRLDRYEGVPWAYEDLVLGVEQLSGSGASSTTPPPTVRALVYVDRARVSPAAPRAEYVVRMNKGIREAGAEWGLPRGYVRDVMRRYIPAADDASSAAAGEGGREVAAGVGMSSGRVRVRI